MVLEGPPQEAAQRKMLRCSGLSSCLGCPHSILVSVWATQLPSQLHASAHPERQRTMVQILGSLPNREMAFLAPGFGLAPALSVVGIWGNE